MKSQSSGAAAGTVAGNVTGKTGHDMTESELYGRAKKLAERVKTAKYPSILPRIARETIQEAAALIEELATREAVRCHEQKTTEKQ